MIDIVHKTDPTTGRVRTVEADLNKKRVVRVLPKNDDLRRVLKHGGTGVGFPTSGGSAEWPYDTFTKRRIKDGDVTIEGGEGETAQAKKKTAQNEQPKT